MNVIDPRTVQRRPIQLHTLADLEAELGLLEQAHRNGTLRHKGNWTPGQILGHLATWLEFGWKGYPTLLQPPLWVKALMRVSRQRFLRSPLPAGFRIPKIEGGTFGREPMEFEEGYVRFRKALEPVRRGEAPPNPSPVFGRVSAEHNAQLLLRHAELHLSYLEY